MSDTTAAPYPLNLPPQPTARRICNHNYTSGRRLVRADHSVVWKGERWMPRDIHGEILRCIPPAAGQRMAFVERRRTVSYAPYVRETLLHAANGCYYVKCDPATMVSEGL